MDLRKIILNFMYYVIVFMVLIVMICSMVFCFSVVFTLNTVINQQEQEHHYMTQDTQNIQNIEEMEDLIYESLK